MQVGLKERADFLTQYFFCLSFIYAGIPYDLSLPHVFIYVFIFYQDVSSMKMIQ